MSADFLSAIWRPGIGEVRYILPPTNKDGRATIRQSFHTDPAEAYQEALGWDGLGWDTYFGVLNRVRNGGKAEDCVPDTQVIWADLDNKNLGGTHMAALMALQRSDLSPSIMVDSGNGLHTFWLLREAVPFARASEAMKGLAKEIGGDHVHDAPRVLRIPGTHNHKSDPPKPVRLLVFNPDRRYRIGDFESYVPETKPSPRATNESGQHQFQPFDDLYDELKERIVNGAGQGKRSEMMFSVCVSLIRRDWSDDQIIDLFQTHSAGIGEKLTEMTEREAERYMRRTLARAREVSE